MSLINEALRRARQEASRKEALRKGAPVPPLQTQLRSSRRLGTTALLLIVGVVLGMALVGGGVALVGGLRAMGQAGAVAQAETVPAAPEPGASLAPGSESATGEPGAEPPAVAEAPSQIAAPGAPGARRESEAAPARPPEPVAREPQTASREVGVVQTSSPRLEARRPEPSPPESPQPGPERRSQPDPTPVAAPLQAAPAPVRSATVRSFVHQAELAGGGAIELGGIAWSERGPSFALLNGRVMSTGEYVEGYKILQIEADQVELGTDDDRLLIRLK